MQPKGTEGQSLKKKISSVKGLTPMPVLLVDTREPDPHPWQPHFTAPVIRGPLSTGDFSLPACENLVCVERKTMSDLISCLCTGRERFERELARTRAISHFWVVCEGSHGNVLRGNHRSTMVPGAAFQSIVALMTRYRIPFLMANDAATAARLCESLHLKWYREHLKFIDLVQRAPRHVG